MGYNRLLEWATTLEDLIYTLCLQGKRLVAKTPLQGLSHLESILLATKRATRRRLGVGPNYDIFDSRASVLSCSVVALVNWLELVTAVALVPMAVFSFCFWYVRNPGG